MHMETSVVVNRPIDDVWAYISDPFNGPRWNTKFMALRPTSPPPLQLGSTLRGRFVMFGSEIKVEGEVVEWDPPTSATFMIRAGMGSGRLAARLEPIPAGTRVVRTSDVELRPILRPLVWIAGPWLRRQGRAYDLNLKRHLEAGEPISTAR
jgi:uncharacterized protein YndB with AHSA1/START domain